jgi:hypothetical protein
MEISSKYPAKSLSKEIAKLRTDTKKERKPFGAKKYYTMESLILAQDERWRQA